MSAFWVKSIINCDRGIYDTGLHFGTGISYTGLADPGSNSTVSNRKKRDVSHIRYYLYTQLSDSIIIYRVIVWF